MSFQLSAVKGCELSLGKVDSATLESFCLSHPMLTQPGQPLGKHRCLQGKTGSVSLCCKVVPGTKLTAMQ